MRALRVLWRLAPVAILLLAALAWRSLPELGLYGWDTYPMIASGSFTSVAEFFGNLGEELMEGHFPGGRYWRPLVHVSFGLDHALWGLDPLGYHITDLTVLALSALAVHSLFRRLIDSEPGALVAGLVYAVHPLHWELLPLPARRADALCALFTVLALRSVAAKAPAGTPKLEQRSLPPWPHIGAWSRPWVAFWCALAMASKETGVLAVPLCFALAWMASNLRASVRAVMPAGVVLLVYMALHTLVLGELGGGPRSSLTGALTNALEFGARYGILLAYPVPFLGQVPPVQVLVAVVVLLVASLVWLQRVVGAAERGDHEPLGGGRALLLAGLWLLLVLLLTSASGVKRSWYAVAFLPAWCLCLGTLAALVGRVLSGGRDRHRFSWLGVIAAVLAAELSGPLIRDIPAEKRVSAEAARDLLERFEAAVEAAAPGTTITVDARPPADAAVRHGEATQRPMTLPPYGLDAYARLIWPERLIRCEVDSATDVAPLTEDELLVLLQSR